MRLLALAALLPALALAGSEFAPNDVVAFSPDGDRAATRTQNGRGVKLATMPLGLAQEDMPGETRGRVTALAFSTDGDTLAVGDEHGELRAWAVSGGFGFGRNPDGQGAVLAMALDRQGKSLAWINQGREAVRVTPLRHSDRLLVERARDGLAPSAVAMDPEARFVALAGVGPLALFGLAPGFQDVELEGLAGGAHAVAISQDGTQIALAGPADPARIYRRQGARWNLVLQVDLHATAPGALSFSPDGSVLAGGTGSEVVLFRTTYPPATRLGSFTLPTDQLAAVQAMPDDASALVGGGVLLGAAGRWILSPEYQALEARRRPKRPPNTRPSPRTQEEPDGWLR